MQNKLTEEHESNLVHKLSKGNLLAFNTLFKEYSHRLFCFAKGYLKSDVESEELVQEVFTRIWENKTHLKSELSFKSYLFTIAFNIIKKHFRARRLFEEYIKSNRKEDLDLQTSQEISYNSLYQYIKGIADQMPPRRRLIFIKSRFERHTIKEISKELNISRKTVENQLSDALSFIRTKIKQEAIPLILFFVLFIS